jgi:hypothetical protein
MEYGHRMWGRSIGAFFYLPAAFFWIRGTLNKGPILQSSVLTENYIFILIFGPISTLEQHAYIKAISVRIKFSFVDWLILGRLATKKTTYIYLSEYYMYLLLHVILDFKVLLKPHLKFDQIRFYPLLPAITGFIESTPGCQEKGRRGRSTSCLPRPSW